MKKNQLPAMEGYQPSTKNLTENLQTKGYQPQTTTATASPNKQPPKKP